MPVHHLRRIDALVPGATAEPEDDVAGAPAE
jgi:hypothetical protein